MSDDFVMKYFKHTRQNGLQWCLVGVGGENDNDDDGDDDNDDDYDDNDEDDYEDDDNNDDDELSPLGPISLV